MANSDKEYFEFTENDDILEFKKIKKKLILILAYNEYLPFGETLADEHLNSINSPFKYNGKGLDDETGNYYYGARYYDPKWSRDQIHTPHLQIGDMLSRQEVLWQLTSLILTFGPFTNLNSLTLEQ